MPRQNKIDTVLCGMGGYGEYYLRSLLDNPESPLRFAGMVDPRPENCSFLSRIEALRIPIFDSLEAFYDRNTAELAIIVSPIHFHADQTVFALEHGSHVLCEKPLGGSLEDAEAMRRARDRAGRIVSIGYQASFHPETQRLKQDILSGVWGKPRAMTCIHLAPRSREYYTRNSWAGRIRDDSGRWIMDSPVNNATAHDLHHMLYLAGGERFSSGIPVETQARLWRAHAIENYDTAVLHSTLDCGTDIRFVTTHTGVLQAGARTCYDATYVFEGGILRYNRAQDRLEGVDAQGCHRQYGARPNQGLHKVIDTVNAIREHRPPLCGLEAAMSQTRCMLQAQQAGEPITEIDPDRIRVVEGGKGEHFLDIDGLNAALREAGAAALCKHSIIP